MRLYLAPKSSLELIRYLRSVNGEEGLAGSPIRKSILNDAISSTRALNELDTTAQFWLSHVERPIQAFVSERTKGTKTKQLITRLFSEQVPFGAFVNIGHSVCVTSPAFSFMQLATHLDTIDLLRIGMELCGTYSQWHLGPGATGTVYSKYQEADNCTYNLPRALNAGRLPSFFERMKGYRGHTSASAASHWLANSSASPMETAVYLLLCLPKRLGGYGLPQPVLNPRLTISNPDGAKERYPDLFWPGPNIDVEYNSDSEHSGQWARYRDSKREVELTVADMRVLPLTRAQLMNVDEFDAFAHGLRRMLGIRSRKPDPRWEGKRAELRQRLLFPG